MGPPNNTQRMDQLEEKYSHLEGTVSEMVAKAVERAVTTMQQALTAQLLKGQSEVARKASEDLEAVAIRLEGRINRSRKNQENLINMMKEDQLKFR